MVKKCWHLENKSVYNKKLEIFELKKKAFGELVKYRYHVKTRSGSLLSNRLRANTRRDFPAFETTNIR